MAQDNMCCDIGDSLIANNLHSDPTPSARSAFEVTGGENLSRDE